MLPTVTSAPTSTARLVTTPSNGATRRRKFSWLAGVGIRIRRVALTSLWRGATVDGPSVFEADMGNEVDNMEGIDAHVTPEGETVLTMVSDDNFSMIQRTLLLQFTLVE